jgi:hypothetical protein
VVVQGEPLLSLVNVHVHARVIKEIYLLDFHKKEQNIFAILYRVVLLETFIHAIPIFSYAIL